MVWLPEVPCPGSLRSVTDVTALLARQCSQKGAAFVVFLLLRIHHERKIVCSVRDLCAGTFLSLRGKWVLKV